MLSGAPHAVPVVLLVIRTRNTYPTDIIEVNQYSAAPHCGRTAASTAGALRPALRALRALRALLQMPLQGGLVAHLAMCGKATLGRLAVKKATEA